MKKTGSVLALVGVLVETIVALQKYEDTAGKDIGKTSYKPGDLIGRLSVNKLGKGQKTPIAQVEPSNQRHKSSLVKTESGEDVYEPPFEMGEIVDRGDHDDLPDYADFPSDEPVQIFSLMPPEVMAPKEIFRMEPPAIKIETKVKVTTVQKNAEESQEISALASTVELERAATATLMMIPEFVMTTVTPTILNEVPREAVKPSDAGWVLFTPGIAPGPHEKGAPTSTASNKYLRQNDALPDALKLISDLWDDAPVFITETYYITTKMLQTPKPKTTETSTSTYLKKYEKGKAKAATTTAPLKINTGLLKHNQPFTIASDDIYRGIHAKNAAHQIEVGLASLMISCIAFLLLFL